MHGLLVALALLTIPISAAADWLQDVLGPYVGPVLNDGVRQTMQTVFSLDDQGHLIGHYHVADDPPFDGELTDFIDDGNHGGLFTWSDRYGEGVVQVHFLPAEGRFVGEWGTLAPVAGQVFCGHRFKAPPTS
jgi:hypothetical protein